MKAFDVLGYAYEADMHCLDCARKRFGPALEDPDTEDSEGNKLSPLFVSSVEQEEVCGDCLQVIPGTEQEKESVARDPTLEEMRAFIDAQPFAEERSEFDREAAIYWFAYGYHGGQTSNLYAALSQSDFEPGPLCNGPKPETIEADLYAALVQEFAP